MEEHAMVFTSDAAMWCFAGNPRDDRTITNPDTRCVFPSPRSGQHLHARYERLPVRAEDEGTTCRLCQSKNLQFLFALKPTPPANEFLPAPPIDGAQDHFPLDVYQCGNCGHVQLIHCVDPERLFRNYVYVSGTSQVFVKHFEEYAAEVIRYVPLVPGDRVLDCGSNDGTLLSFFQKAGMEVLGIDPARKIAEEATRRGIPTWPEFFDQRARKLTTHPAKEFGTAQVVTANNMFAHADGLPDILDGMASLLDPKGIFVFEVSYLLDVIERNLFDTIYHEHLSYHSVKPLVSFMQRHGLKLVRVLADGSTASGEVRFAVMPARLRRQTPAGDRRIPRWRSSSRRRKKAGLYRGVHLHRLSRSHQPPRRGIARP